MTTTTTTQQAVKADRLLSVKQVQAVLGLSEGTVRTLLRNGDLAHVRPSPGRVMVRESALSAYIEALELVHGAR